MKKFIACYKLCNAAYEGEYDGAFFALAYIVMFLIYEGMTQDVNGHVDFVTFPIWTTIISGVDYFPDGPMNSMLPVTDRFRAAFRLLSVPCVFLFGIACIVGIFQGERLIWSLTKEGDFRTLTGMEPVGLAGGLTLLFLWCGFWFFMKRLNRVKQERARKVGWVAMIALWELVCVGVSRILSRQGHVGGIQLLYLPSLWGGWYLVLGSFVFCLITGLSAWRCYARPRVRDPKAPAWFPLEADEGDDRDEAELEVKQRTRRRRRIVIRTLIVAVLAFLLLRQP